MRALTSGASSAFCSAADSLATTGSGVPAGASTTFHSYASAPGTPASASVGTSGRMGVRLPEVTARARSLPLWMCCSVEARLPKNTGTCPPITSFRAGPPPL